MSIAQEITRIKNCKTLIREAIVEKGVAVPENDLLDKYPDYIKEIKAGGLDIKLQEKTVTIFENGQQIITPDEGYALSGVTVNAAIMGEASALDFTVLGYPLDLSTELNAEFNADIAYSRSFMPVVYDQYLFRGDTRLKYAPAPDSVVTVWGLFDGCVNLSVVPEFEINSPYETNTTSMFQNCSSLVEVPYLDLSTCSSTLQMFKGCTQLKTVPLYETNNVEVMQEMFYGCTNLTEIPYFDTSNVTNLFMMCYGCKKITTVPAFNTSKVTTMQDMLTNCSALTSIPEFDCVAINDKNLYPFNIYGGTQDVLTDVGGFKNMKYSWDSAYGLAKCPNLTYQSCINILNGLYDFTGNGETPNSNQGKIKLHPNFLTTVGDEINIGTNKGWTITT